MRAAAICSGVVVLPTARRAGSPDGKLDEDQEREQGDDEQDQDHEEPPSDQVPAHLLLHLLRLLPERRGSLLATLRLAPLHSPRSQADQCFAPPCVERRQPGELVERVVDDVIRDDVHVVVEEVRRERHHVLHQVLVEVGPTLEQRVARRSPTGGDLVVDTVDGRDRRVAPTLDLGGGGSVKIAPFVPGWGSCTLLPPRLGGANPARESSSAVSPDFRGRRSIHSSHR